MNAPLRLSFEVACPVDHAFSVWTEQIGRWWPKDHTVSGADDAEVIMEAGVGGRVYERTSDGVERDWGEVRQWDPPESLVYLWHIGQDRAEATEVQIRFLAQGAEPRESRSNTAAGSVWGRAEPNGGRAIKVDGSPCWPTTKRPRRKERTDGPRHQRGPVGVADAAGHLGVLDVPRARRRSTGPRVPGRYHHAPLPAAGDRGPGGLAPKTG